MPTDKFDVTCSHCGARFSLSNRAVDLVTAFDGAGATCPQCGKHVVLDRDLINAARIARGDIPPPKPIRSFD